MAVTQFNKIGENSSNIERMVVSVESTAKVVAELNDTVKEVAENQSQVLYVGKNSVTFRLPETHDKEVLSLPTMENR